MKKTRINFPKNTSFPLFSRIFVEGLKILRMSCRWMTERSTRCLWKGSESFFILTHSFFNSQGYLTLLLLDLSLPILNWFPDTSCASHCSTYLPICLIVQPTYAIEMPHQNEKDMKRPLSSVTSQPVAKYGNMGMMFVSHTVADLVKVGGSMVLLGME